MDFSKISLVIRVVIIIIIYLIIFFALRIMYKDLKGGNKKNEGTKNNFGLEIIKVGDNPNLKAGAVIVLHNEISIGRKEDNMLILNEQYVSGHHARIYLKNTEYILQDLQSTNGTFLNSKKVDDKEYLRIGDEIQIGELVMKLIG